MFQIFDGLLFKSLVEIADPSVLGNETVDQQAKTSLSLEPISFKMPLSNIKPSINKYVLDQWQTSWNNSIGNKLLEVKTNYW